MVEKWGKGKKARESEIIVIEDESREGKMWVKRERMNEIIQETVGGELGISDRERDRKCYKKERDREFREKSERKERKMKGERVGREVGRK